MKKTFTAYAKTCIMFLFIAGTIASCGKDDDNNNPPSTTTGTTAGTTSGTTTGTTSGTTSGSKTQMLTDKNWKLVALTSDPAINYNGTMVTNVFVQPTLWPDCNKDDTERYTASSSTALNGIYSYDQGTVKCDPAHAQTVTGSWAFNTTETVLSVTEGGQTVSYDIEELTAANLRLSFATTINNVSHTLRATYTPQ